MTIVALSHGYPPLWNMGGEVSLHRSMAALAADQDVRARVALTDLRGEPPYDLDGVTVMQVNLPNVLDTRADPRPLALQLKVLGATVVIAQNELSLPGVFAAREIGIPSIVYVHTPVKYGSSTREAIPLADYALYNTATSAGEWGEPGARVLHPLTDIRPSRPGSLSTGDTYTLLSSLGHKGVEAVLEVAGQMPERKFLIVESPAVSMEPPNLRARIAALPNVELAPRVPPEQVAEAYFSRTRILLVPSRYETYGMSAIEAASHGIPSAHVDTPHVREGIGPGALLIPGLNGRALAAAIQTIEADYETYSASALDRAHFLAGRERSELTAWARFISTGPPMLTDESHRVRVAQLRRGRPLPTTPAARNDALLERRQQDRDAREALRLINREALLRNPPSPPSPASRRPRPHGSP